MSDQVGIVDSGRAVSQESVASQGQCEPGAQQPRPKRKRPVQEKTRNDLCNKGAAYLYLGEQTGLGRQREKTLHSHDSQRSILHSDGRTNIALLDELLPVDQCAMLAAEGADEWQQQSGGLEEPQTDEPGPHRMEVRAARRTRDRCNAFAEDDGECFEAAGVKSNQSDEDGYSHLGAHLVPNVGFGGS